MKIIKNTGFFAATILIVSLIYSVSQASAQKVKTTAYKTPQAAAKALYEAWHAKSKTKARAAADDKAVAKLFGTNFIARRRFANCADESETEKGLFVCVFEDPTDDLLNVAFETIKKGKGWRVRWVTFAAEN